MIEIGKAIRIVRQAKGMRLKELAKAAPISVPFLSLVENGDRQPSLKVLRDIARALGVPSEALILLAQETDTTLSTSDDATSALMDSIERLAEAEDALRRSLTESTQA